MTDDYVKDQATQSLDRVWRLINKYYTANVRVHALSDHGRLEVDPDTIEAHVIYLVEEEVIIMLHILKKLTLYFEENL